MEHASDYPLVHPFVKRTLNRLIDRGEYRTARWMARGIYRALPPDDPEACDFLAAILHRCYSRPEALEASLRTLALDPDNIVANYRVANCWYAVGRPDEAERVTRSMLERWPGWVPARVDLSSYICCQGRYDEALAMVEELLPTLVPGDLHITLLEINLGWHQLRQWKFKEGMKNVGLGRTLRKWGAMAYAFKRPMLDSKTDVRGKTILLWGEGGAGDEIINARFAQVIRERGGNCVWLSHQKLESLLARSPGIAATVTEKQARCLEFDYWAPGTNLVQILDLDLAELPNMPYLSPHPDYVQKWQRIIRPTRNLKIGLRWQGNEFFEQDTMRAIPFSVLERLLKIPGVDFYSLQKDEAAAQRPKNSPVVDLAPRLKNWEDTAGAFSQLDLVISSCTSVPHLAAAMGKPAWVFCPMTPYPPWALPGETSPWYPSVRLFRRERWDSWEEPFARVYRQLESLARGYGESTSVLRN